MKIFRRLLSYSLKYKYRFMAGIFFAVLTALINASSITVLIPLFDALGSDKKTNFHLDYTAPEYNILIKEKMFGRSSLDGLEKLKRLIIVLKFRVNNAIKDMDSTEIVWTICKLIVPLYVMKMICFLLSVFCIATSGYNAVRDLRQELFDKVQTLPLTYFYKEKTGLLMSRIINDAEIIAAIISSNLRDAIINFFYVITHLFVLLYLNTELLLIASITVPVIIYPVTLFTKKISKSTSKFQERMADLNANVQEMISGIRVIRSFSMEDHELEKFNDINTKLSHRNFKGQFYLQVAPGLVELTSSIVVLGFFAIGAKLIFNGSFTQGEFMAFLLTLLFLLRPLTQLSQMFGKITQAKISGERIFEIIDKENSESHEEESGLHVSPLKKSIQFKNIHFQYPETNSDVLHGIDFEIKIGDTVAFVGSSGSGKSTLMDLIPRFYNLSIGEITFDGINISEYNLHDLRRKIGIVTQNIFLFHGTVAENIAYGRPNSNLNEIIEAAKLANAHEFIMEMEHGYNSFLGVRGLNLSGGQRQRLVIARALLRNPEILILDEATSALDAQTEKLVGDALDRLFKNRTTFIIAHRLSTIRRIPKIVVMDSGQIAEVGNHESLIAQNGLYAKLYESQFVPTQV
ncbi:MAG: ABC transporter ATP-binding protein [Leptospiraceae bacterium]|nr:ABC transporter ATP-binding protein [Leptospiraceae bacterium]MBK9499644.1 ABC transporter ATP-binding protein [Leptospiraceae bacterium]MBL0262301.1 ABC transporter ATP-binding protein [Leptospiraceae bacterium]MBP9162323.1 ABC transporter ATP-binding protein [Leptospiraceae bacterium]